MGCACLKEFGGGRTCMCGQREMSELALMFFIRCRDEQSESLLDRRSFISTFCLYVHCMPIYRGQSFTFNTRRNFK